MELPFAVESPERTSQVLQAEHSENKGGDDDDDDGSSLVTTSSQGSFLAGSGSSENEEDVYGTVNLDSTVVTNPPQPPIIQQQQQQLAYGRASSDNSKTKNNLPRQRPPHPQLPQPIQQYHFSANPSAPIMQQQQQQTPFPNPIPQQPSQPHVHHMPAPTTATTAIGAGIATGLNIFGNLRVPSYLQSSSRKAKPSPQSVAIQEQPPAAVETIDFTYVNVCETDADEVDISLDAQHTAMEGLQGTLGGGEEKTEDGRGDILALLLSGATSENADNEAFVFQCEEAYQNTCQALEAKKEGDLQGALQAHAVAAKAFRECAVLIKEKNVNMANSLLLLSQTQAKSALALKRIVKQQQNPASPHENDDDANRGRRRGSQVLTQKDRLRAAVRGALVTRNEEDISDSAFLGKATKGPMTSSMANAPNSVAKANDTGSNSNAPNAAVSGGANTSSSQSSSGGPSQNNPQHNPVDDMMELERELRDMDMALELGNSIASLDARTQSRLKNSIVDGSFMVVPGSESYMSSSNMWSPNPSSAPRSNPRNNNNATNNIIKQNQAAQARAAAVGAQNARKNRVQNILQASAHHHPMTAGPSGRHAAPPIQHQQHLPPQYQNAPKPPTQQQVSPSPGLESSWWGSSSTTSQVLASSVISLGASSMLVPGEGGSQTVTSSADIGQTGANTKQIMQLMDALKTLGDENAELLREVKGAEAARMEAKAAKEQIARFKAEYGKRFTALKAALEKFRKGHPENTPVDGNEPNPVTHSNYMQSASASEQLQRQEQLIRKLTADLKKEKEESKKKDAALKKYETFYREVKARSAQKAAQRQRDAVGGGQKPPQQQHGATRRPGQR